MTGRLFYIAIVVLASCTSSKETGDKKMVKLITLDPGHFHAGLVQKTMYDQVDSTVYVYAPAGDDIRLHLDRINAYNTRQENPTHWNEVVYTGDDYFEKMLAEKKGNTVVLAGNNRKKTDYILGALDAGLNVLADKPMVINSAGFSRLKSAFDKAKEKDLLLYDIMTERFEITSILQKELSQLPGIFGSLEEGSATEPSVVMESGHCFYKNISGRVLTRPAWFLDADQQGQGIVDVTTHLVDLVQWECFPEQALDYTKDIKVDSAVRWPTTMSLAQFKAITQLDSFPGFLAKNRVGDTILNIWSNGTISYRVRNVHARVSVGWSYQSDAGGDTHYSMMQGTKSKLEIRQGKNEQYLPVLYIVMNRGTDTSAFQSSFQAIRTKYPGVDFRKNEQGWEVTIPAKYKEGHEAHFARVMEHYLEYLEKKNMPAWEVTNMLAKYYTTTTAADLINTP